MNTQLLHQCATCPVFVSVADRLCATCSEPPLTIRTGERRKVVVWRFGDDRRANVDRRGISPEDWLAAVDRIHQLRRF